MPIENPLTQGAEPKLTPTKVYGERGPIAQATDKAVMVAAQMNGTTGKLAQATDGSLKVTLVNGNLCSGTATLDGAGSVNLSGVLVNPSSVIVACWSGSAGLGQLQVNGTVVNSNQGAVDAGLSIKWIAY